VAEAKQTSGNSGHLHLGWQVDALVELSALGYGVGSFVCWVSRFLLPGMKLDYGKWGGVGAALGLLTAIVFIGVDTLFY
jgi:hypothetical protein